MKLPPVDQYRAPFVEPIGHLAMQTAYAEDELIELCANIPSHKMANEEVAHQLRNWNAETLGFIDQRLSLISDNGLQDQARDAIKRYDELRVARHRAVHDAISIGLMVHDDGYDVKAMGVEYRRGKGSTSIHYNYVTPDVIADLACQMYDVQKDFNMITSTLTSPRYSND